MKSKSKFFAIAMTMFFVAFISNQLHAQQAQAKLPSTENSATWQLLKSEGAVTVYYKTTISSNNKVIVMKIVNNSTESKSVSFSFWDGSAKRTVTVKPGETLEGKINTPAPEALVVIVPADKTERTMNTQINVTSIK